MIAGLLFTYARAWDCALKKPAAVSYFWPLLACYRSALILTNLVMILSGAAQPALLYLVPCTLLPFLFMAWQRGELRPLWFGHDPNLSVSDRTVEMNQADVDRSIGVDQQRDEVERIL